MNAFKQLYISYFAWIPQKAAVFKQASNKRFVKSYHYSWISRFEDTQTHDAVKPQGLGTASAMCKNHQTSQKMVISRSRVVT